jgi:hypothetical protein
MKHSLSRPAIAVSAAYLVIAGVLVFGQGYGGFMLGMPWTAAICLSKSDTAINSIVAGSIFANAIIVYLAVATYLRLPAQTLNGVRREETMDTFLLTKRQFFVFASIATVLTIPFLGLTVCGIKNEGALILILPFLAGMPWVLLYFWLPFDIPGFTSAGIPDQSGNLTVTVFQLVLLMLPVFLNIYIAVRLISGGRRRNELDR